MDLNLGEFIMMERYNPQFKSLNKSKQDIGKDDPHLLN
jgi:hypothetical protein